MTEYKLVSVSDPNDVVIVKIPSDVTTGESKLHQWMREHNILKTNDGLLSYNGHVYDINFDTVTDDLINGNKRVTKKHKIVLEILLNNNIPGDLIAKRFSL